jgi:hypothetical protein
MKHNANDNKLIKQDINFLEYPLWFQDERPPEGFVWKDLDGFTYRAAYKPPTRLDGLCLMYWMLSSQNEGWAEHICLTQRKNMSACGLQAGKSKAERLKDCCERWINVTVKFKGTFYDGKRYEVLQFNIINHWWIDKETRHLHIEFNKFWLEKIRHSSFFKLINFDEIRNLRSPRAARLYELLVKNFQARDTWTIDAHKLARKFPMAYKYVSQVIRDVERALADMDKHTSLKVDMSVEKYAKGKARLHFRKLDGNAKDISSNNNLPCKSDLASEVRELTSLLNEKRKKQKAVIDLLTKALEEHGFSYVRRNLLYANEKAKRNYRVFLDKALKEDWGLGWWEDEKKAGEPRYLPELPQQDKDGDEITRERERRCEARDYIDSLNKIEYDDLSHVALKGLDEETRKKIMGGNYFAGVMLKRKMESLVMEGEWKTEKKRVR